MIWHTLTLLLSCLRTLIMGTNTGDHLTLASGSNRKTKSARKKNADSFMGNNIIVNVNNVSLRAGNEFSCGLMNSNQLYTDESIQSIKKMKPKKLVSANSAVFGFLLFIQHEMAKRIFKKEGCDYDHYDDLKKLEYIGYAHDYLQQKWNDSSLKNEAKLSVYKSLFEIDSQLGTKAELQLFKCCQWAVNLDIIMVIHIN